MSFQPHNRRRGLPALATALALLALAAPAALASAADPRSQAPTSSLAGTTSTPAGVTSALAQEAYYSSYGEPTPAPLPSSARAVSVDAGDGIAPVPFVLAILGALIVGIGATSGVHVLARRRRARLA